jgi:hypothetical protein
MTSVIDICNRALSHTGTDQAIASLGEKSKEARVCSRWYVASRDQLLRTFAWNFAQRRVVLADMGDPPGGWAYRYRYPTDCVDLQRVFASGDYQPGTELDGLDMAPFRIASDGEGGRLILSNVAQAEALYTARVEDPNLFPADFATTLELTLATNIAMPMLAQPKISDYLASKARQALNEAMAANLNEGHYPNHPDAEWVRDRFGGA